MNYSNHKAPDFSVALTAPLLSDGQAVDGWLARLNDSVSTSRRCFRFPRRSEISAINIVLFCSSDLDHSRLRRRITSVDSRKCFRIILPSCRYASCRCRAKRTSLQRYGVQCPISCRNPSCSVSIIHRAKAPEQRATCDRWSNLSLNNSAWITVRARSTSAMAACSRPLAASTRWAAICCSTCTCWAAICCSVCSRWANICRSTCSRWAVSCRSNSPARVASARTPASYAESRSRAASRRWTRMVRTTANIATAAPMRAPIDPLRSCIHHSLGTADRMADTPLPRAPLHSSNAHVSFISPTFRFVGAHHGVV